jgi:hypothetical protein
LRSVARSAQTASGDGSGELAIAALRFFLRRCHGG